MSKVIKLLIQGYHDTMWPFAFWMHNSLQRTTRTTIINWSNLEQKLQRRRLFEVHIVLIIDRAFSAQCGKSQTAKSSYVTGSSMASVQIGLIPPYWCFTVSSSLLHWCAQIYLCVWCGPDSRSSLENAVHYWKFRAFQQHLSYTLCHIPLYSLFIWIKRRIQTFLAIMLILYLYQ